MVFFSLCLRIFDSKAAHFLLLLLLVGCAKTGYLVEQGLYQLKIQNSGRLNNLVLRDIKVKKEEKKKIMDILKYKKYFYTYFGRKKTSIYHKTTFLDGDAVSYLVISSPYYKVQAHKECFPVMGCFPYLGFFKKKSAIDYIKKQEEKDFATYMRPVYAYSSLGYFTDTILSSFFHLGEMELAELIFHELFHTLFFPKNEVELNENMANFFARKLLKSYFKLSSKSLLEREKKDKKQAYLNQELVLLIKLLNKEYGQYKNLTRKKAKNILETFLSSTFVPRIKGLCQRKSISHELCFPLHRKWNNASLAAFLTYENKSNEISLLYKKLGLSPQKFLIYIEKTYKKFEKTDRESFAKYLLKKE